MGRLVNRFPELFKEYKKRMYEEKGERQGDIAERWEVDPSTLSRYANGLIQTFNLPFLEMICNEMGVKPGDVLDWEKDD